MTVQEYEKKIKDIVSEVNFSDIHTSPDFQCDQTGGFPTSLCVCFEKGKAWLELNENLLADIDDTELDYCRKLCADFGIRTCWNNGQFNALLKELGDDAYGSAFLPDEDEEMGMQL